MSIMEKIITYKVRSNELALLEDYLCKAGYHISEFVGAQGLVIDDGNANLFEDSTRDGSIFFTRGGTRTHYARVEANNSVLVKVIEAFFAQ